MKITLKAARVNAGLSQDDVTKQLHISKTTLVNWEQGHVALKACDFLKLCELYNIEPDCIFLPKY